MYCHKCGAHLQGNEAFCNNCGAALGNGTAPVQNTIPNMNTILYQGICLQRLSGMTTAPGDAVITPQGLYYYKRSMFLKKIGKKPCDFFVDSRNVMYIQQSIKNVNQVMELTMSNGSVLEFYSPNFSRMFAAMNEAVRLSRA